MPPVAGVAAVKRIDERPEPRPGDFLPIDSYVHTQHGRWSHYPYALWTKDTRSPVGWVAPV